MEVMNGRPTKLHIGDRIIAVGWPTRTSAVVVDADNTGMVTLDIGGERLAAVTFDEEGYLQLKSTAGTHFGRVFPDKGTKYVHTNPFMKLFQNGMHA